MPATSRSMGCVVAAALGMTLALMTSGCWLMGDPVGEPATPEPLTVTPTPVEPDRLAIAAEACGTSQSTPAGDTSFVGQSSWPAGALLPADMRVAVSLTVTLEASHGDHTVDLSETRGVVTDADGTVVGVMVGLSAPEGDSGGAAYSARVYVTLGTCPTGGVGLGDPLPDGGYALVLSGPVRPVDHDHVQAEYWIAEPLEFTVADGEIVLPAD